MGYIITDDPNQPIILGRLPIVVGRIEFYPFEPTTRDIARLAIEQARRKTSRRTIADRVKAKFSPNKVK